MKDLTSPIWRIPELDLQHTPPVSGKINDKKCMKKKVKFTQTLFINIKSMLPCLFKKSYFLAVALKRLNFLNNPHLFHDPSTLLINCHAGGVKKLPTSGNPKCGIYVTLFAGGIPQ